MFQQKTQQRFIFEAKLIHEGFYNYDKTYYFGSQTRVEIICPIHGSFFQFPGVHLSGSGCAECAGNKKLTKEKFIEKAKEIHGNEYDYSKVNYRSYKHKVEIICPLHGSFIQVAGAHLFGEGCFECYGSKQLTLGEFLKKAKEVHGEFYDYTDVNLVNCKTKVDIKCPIHGIFSQQAKYHLDGGDCPKCTNAVKSNSEEFIQKAKKVHGDFYSYDMVNYINKRTRVDIICPVHSLFSQVAEDHLRGNGCSKCAFERKLKRDDTKEYTVNKKLTTQQFIEKSREKHGDFYNYEKVNYINNKTKVNIECPVHGIFSQKPSSHLEGKGCLECSREKLRKRPKLI